MPEYKAIISSEASEMKADLKDLRTGLAKANWLMRVLGLPPDQRQAFMEMQKMIRTLYTLQMVLAGTSVAGGVMTGLRLAGVGRAVPIQEIKWVFKISGAK